MSEIVAAKAVQGAQELVGEAERMLQQMLAQPEPHARLSFPNTIYYLPIILSNTGKAVEAYGDLQPVLQRAKVLLGQAKDEAVGIAALLAAEVIEGLRSPDGQFDSRLTDAQVRSWGVPLADGRMSGIALILGPAKNSAVALRLIEELRRLNMLCLLSGTAQGSLWDQGPFESGGLATVIPTGKDSVSAVHAMGFAARCAMKLGGHKPGEWPKILSHSTRRVPGFVLAFGDLQDRDLAMILGAAQFGFSLITVPSVDLDDPQHVPQFAQKCLSVRGLKPKLYGVHLPVDYGPAFEDESIEGADLSEQFGGNGSCAFELLQADAAGVLTDGKTELIGPAQPPHGELGIVVKVAGAKVQPDFEPYLEQQLQQFINYARGVQHTGRQDRISIRVSKAAAQAGFDIQWLAKIIHTRFHEEFGTAIEKVEVLLITDPECHAEWLEKARLAYESRRQRVAALTDDQVDVFYVCTHCRTFAPNNVSIISPERVSPCGECNWFDARASSVLDPAGYRRPIKLGKAIDPKKGMWEGTNKYARTASHGRMSEVSLYSIMQTPMGACGDFECMVVLIPEANGVLVLSHEDTSMRTPAGISLATFSSLTAGEQIPGVVGIGRSYLLSRKFLYPEGGFKRVVWMSSRIKERMADELRAVCEREGEPALMEKIADEQQVTTVQQLVTWLREHQHPALQMEKMF